MHPMNNPNPMGYNQNPYPNQWYPNANLPIQQNPQGQMPLHHTHPNNPPQQSSLHPIQHPHPHPHPHTLPPNPTHSAPQHTLHHPHHPSLSSLPPHMHPHPHSNPYPQSLHPPMTHYTPHQHPAAQPTPQTLYTSPPPHHLPPQNVIGNTRLPPQSHIPTIGASTLSSQPLSREPPRSEPTPPLPMTNLTKTVNHLTSIHNPPPLPDSSLDPSKHLPSAPLTSSPHPGTQPPPTELTIEERKAREASRNDLLASARYIGNSQSLVGYLPSPTACQLVNAQSKLLKINQKTGPLPTVSACQELKQECNAALASCVNHVITAPMAVGGLDREEALTGTSSWNIQSINEVLSHTHSLRDSLHTITSKKSVDKSTSIKNTENIMVTYLSNLQNNITPTLW